jgi:hypothetical protein
LVWSASDQRAYSFRSQHTGSRQPGRVIYKSSSIAISRCLSISLISCCSGREEYHRARRGLPTSGSRNELPGLLLGHRRSLVCQAASTIWSSDRNRISTRALVLQAAKEQFSVHVLLQIASMVAQILTSRSAASSSAHYHIACPMSQSRTKVQIIDAKTATAITISGQSDVWKLATARAASE